ncbi:magnesium chelatase subunit D [Variovorax rhizosphaerae]|uniref:Magnesium chelatase subunit D n=1 Tax=Variovorax rhizosphaerae TaxID=1836200 RepID=A0ABU8WPN9_9BURK
MNFDAPSVGAAADAAADATTMAALMCVDPCGLGGVVLRGGAGPRRDAWLRQVAGLLPEGAPLRRVPLGIQEDRLLGALDLAATLAAGRPIHQQGLLAESDGGIVVLGMAERIEPRTAALVAAVLDTQEIGIERHGASDRRTVRIGVIALDEGSGDEERAPDRLLDRLAGRIEIQPGANGDHCAAAAAWTRSGVARARTLLPQVVADDAMRQALCAAALALGIDSLRAPILAIRAARAHAALDDRIVVSQADAIVAARLVLLPRATTLPTAADEQEAGDEHGDRSEPSSADGEGDVPGEQRASRPMEDAILAAASAVLPPGLLALLTAGGVTSQRLRREGRFGVRIAGGSRGRPNGVLRGHPRSGARLNLMETLRAAAPWQALRRREVETPNGSSIVQVRRDDFRLTRFKQRSETTTLFAVDASGSAALHRLGEAKGAVELLLADCYVRRDRVALIAFRGRSAEVLLPPTRSLARARRCLAGLAGGGGTPLATAIESMLALADATRRRGCTPVAVWLTDGRANVALDGTGGRHDAAADALRMARCVRAAGVRALVLDTSAHPHDAARELAREMGAIYLPLPHADASQLSSVVRAATGACGR